MLNVLLVAVLSFGAQMYCQPGAEKAQTIIKIIKASKGTPAAEYQKKLDEMTERYKNETHAKSFVDLKFKNTAGKVRTWGELNKLEKQVYLLMKIEHLSKDLDQLNEAWKEELGAFPSPAMEKIPPPQEDGKKVQPLPPPGPLLPFPEWPKLLNNPVKMPTPATREEIEKFIGSLTSLRKKLAVRHESTVEKMYSAFPDVFTDAEAEYHLRVLRSHHDEEKLVERTKK